ncbi:MAG TPA: N-acetylmuramoyl-L-alanine amidase [Bryobacteraceae bacterium]|nr:N-acetylmuramoyl-L-alanine amidase [Bryobacteraceae bacterium]
MLGVLLTASAFGLAADRTPDSTDAARVTAVRFWSLGGVTRIAIEVSSEFHFKYEHLENPGRLYFDIFGAKPDMARRGVQTIHVDDGLVRQLRVAETQPGVTRIVVDLLQPAGLSASQLSNPDRLMIEVKSEAKGSDKPPLPGVSGGQKPSEPVPGNEALVSTAKPAASLPSAAPAPRNVVSVSGPAAVSPVTAQPGPSHVVADSPVKAVPAVKAAVPKPPVETARVSEARKPVESGKSTEPTRETVEKSNPAADKATPLAAAQPRVASLPPEPLGVEPPTTRDDIQAVLPAKRGTVSDRSLTRALGLKLGRVAIDPGHGGHDVGTHGPSGYLEKDLSLDVARRLAALVEDRMGSEVILTRTDDAYVGLEERTRIANDRKADLFLSIHANSSTYRAAAGVETYILNFTTSKSAMDLAARENAGSDLAIHDLQDLLQKIALRDKIEESQELASSLQTSLSVLSTRSNDAAKNRGVKKAPFVVLIGATMPSVLAEIGFLSNASDEALLRKPEHRQKIAEALYKGIASYADTLSHLIARQN